MEKLIGLPRNAVIKIDGRVDLIIKNGETEYKDSLLIWVAFIFINNQWNAVLPQLISQGFKIEGFVEECLTDLQYLSFFRPFLYWWGVNGKFEITEKVISGSCGKKISSEIAEALKNAKHGISLRNF